METGGEGVDPAETVRAEATGGHRAVPPAAAGGPAAIAPDALALVGGTPLVRLRRLPDAGGAEVVAKIESRNPGGSVKDRIAVAMVDTAESEGRLHAGDTLVEATSGNTGIGLAVVAAVRGYHLVLTMPEDMNAERKALFAWFGVEVVLTPAIEGMSGAVFAAQEIVRGRGAFWPRQFDNPANPEVHYRTTGPEVWEAAGGAVDALVAGVGTGGTLTGAGRFLKERNPACRVVAVEPVRSNVLSGGRPGPTRILGLGAGFLPGVLDRSLIDEVVAVSDEAAYDTARSLARSEGLLVGPSSGAAVWAALRVARGLGAGRRVVVILPDTGDRYTSGMMWAARRGGGEVTTEPGAPARGTVPGGGSGTEASAGSREGPVPAPREGLALPAALRDAMVAHAQAVAPMESCGIVAGRGERPLRFYATRNAANSPVRYSIDPEDLLRITLDIEGRGEVIWGIFHSHPQTEAYPSQTDIRLAYYPEAVYLICSLADRDRPVLRAFRIGGGQVREMDVAVG